MSRTRKTVAGLARGTVSRRRGPQRSRAVGEGGGDPRGIHTRERLLRSAERLFAERGCHATSVRDLAAKAGVNLAAVCYHFGSKQRLLVEALARQIRPLNARRLAALEAVLAAASPPALEAILDAFSRALVEEALSDTGRARRLHRLLSRAFAEADEVAELCFREELLPVALRFLGAVRKARPGLSAERATLGLVLYAGCTVQVLRWAAQPPLPELRTALPETPQDFVLGSLVAFGVAGFDALGAAGGAGPVVRRGKGRVQG